MTSVDALSKLGAETAPASRRGSESKPVLAKGRETPATNRTRAPTDVLASLKKKWKRIAKRAKDGQAASTSKIPHPSSSNSAMLPKAVNPVPKRGRMVAYTLVALGDDNVGIKALTNLDFISTYDPTPEDSYRRQVVIDEQPCMIEVLETGDQEQYTALRDQWIRDGDGFLLVYCITKRSSFDRVRGYYDLVQEVKQSSLRTPRPGIPITSYSPPVPMMLVGNNSDRVTEREVSEKEGQNLAKELGCDFVETSVKDSINVEKAFYDVVRQLRRQAATRVV
ncbi:Small GTPase superfamily Ras type protein [Rutstroemia sp. NJR-2017a BBW]|nr:Small GTPase superfamily Ras type protein [Rutstroemia sp. NJR-2017a BBW]